MQNLMEGLSNALLNHGPVKVFAENFDNSEEYDQNSKLEIERISDLNYSENTEKQIVLKNLWRPMKLEQPFLIIGKY